MRIFKSECPPDYSTYTFSYAEYAMYEKGDLLGDLYKMGFLPYTGDITLKEPLYYRCRSLRINLSKYEPTSENRRVNRKINSENFTVRIVPKPKWEDLDPGLKQLALEYASERFTSGEMPESRFKYVYNREAATDLILFESDDVVVGFVLAGMDETSVHYWFAFFDWHRLKSVPIGKWMMWKSIDIAEKNGKKYVYLGTCYGEKSLYKVRDFKGVEYHDGNAWSDDIDLLKSMCKWDGRNDRADYFKFNRRQAD